MKPRAAELLEDGEEVIFDKRHSLWEIWKNFLIGAGAIFVLALLLTKFKPGPSESGGTAYGYIILISILALFILVAYGLLPLFRRRRMPERKPFFPMLVIILSICGWVALFWFRNSTGFSDKWEVLAWVGFVVVIVGWLAYPLLKWYFTHFLLTDRRLIFNSGILNKKSKMIPLDQVNDITGSQNLWERVFGYGDVVIESAGEFGQEAFTNIGDPVQVRTQILQQRRLFEEGKSSRASMEMAREVGQAIRQQQPAADTTAQGPGPGGRELELVEGLGKLDELRRSGALTEAEFQAAKRELMDRLHEQ
jgi:membrane protein YdbS with pleckstrin-like domain